MDTINGIENVHNKENSKSIADLTDIRKADSVATKKMKPRKRKSSGGSASAPAQLAPS
jgi:hypothetical protein